MGGWKDQREGEAITVSSPLCRPIIGCGGVMTVVEDTAFPGHLFPASFTVLYCPYEDDCPHELPFTSAGALLDHLEGAHGMHVENPPAVRPFLDRYLRARLAQPGLSEQQDLELRETLQRQRLQEILEMQAQERSTVHRQGRHCLFCPTHCPDLPQLFAHMFRTHDFNIGQLDNLVMVDEFLSVLQAKLDRLVCIYCEGRFPNTPTLKKHLKNKRHYRIHTHNHAYDKYYIVNYLQVGKLYSEEETVAAATTNSTAAGDQASVPPPLPRDDDDDEVGRERGGGEDPEWEELVEPVDERTACLLCAHIDVDPEACLEHMKMVHGFDWERLRRDAGLGTYEAIKLINYFRHCSSLILCPYCGDQDEHGSFATEVELAGHLRRLHHHPAPAHLPDRRAWDTPRFLFPVYDDDPFLCHLDVAAEEAGVGKKQQERQGDPCSLDSGTNKAA